jgi:exosome complex RNA-binding protein Rrp4
MPALLGDAIPRVTAILISRDRRYATVDGGQIVAIGDRLGRRTVIGMDERSVVFQEPSGVQIRVGLGGRLLGAERTPR